MGRREKKAKVSQYKLYITPPVFREIKALPGHMRLYVLLTGRHPYRLTNRTPQQVERAIAEEEPEKLGHAPDLDNIVRMALRKEPERRYASVEQFADDIGHYLEGRPILARPDTLVYRGAKF